MDKREKDWAVPSSFKFLPSDLKKNDRRWKAKNIEAMIDQTQTHTERKKYLAGKTNWIHSNETFSVDILLLLSL